MNVQKKRDAWLEMLFQFLPILTYYFFAILVLKVNDALFRLISGTQPLFSANYRSEEQLLLRISKARESLTISG